MNWIILSLVLFYGIGFVLVFLANQGPVTLALALVRAAVWPVYVTTGWPYGYNRGPD